MNNPARPRVLLAFHLVYPFEEVDHLLSRVAGQWLAFCEFALKRKKLVERVVFYSPSVWRVVWRGGGNETVCAWSGAEKAVLVADVLYSLSATFSNEHPMFREL